jgi:hypothetical protein
MNIRQTGEELNQLSRLLFDSAARKWYGAIAVEVGSGVLAVIVGLTHFADDIAFFFTFVGVLLLVGAYALRLRFAEQYGVAETMRRQSILSEALDWPVDKIQMSEWQQRAGRNLRRILKLKPREPDYYATTQEVGYTRLVEMTMESAFYTRHFYIRIRTYIWTVFTVVTLAVVILSVIALTNAVPKTVSMLVAQALVLILPTVLAVDLVGWGIRLQGLINGIHEVEVDLDRLLQAKDTDLPHVMRLISEYNCQVVSGLPIHNWIFNRWHNEICELWQDRNK